MLGVTSHPITPWLLWRMAWPPAGPRRGELAALGGAGRVLGSSYDSKPIAEPRACHTGFPALPHHLLCLASVELCVLCGETALLAFFEPFVSFAFGDFGASGG